MYQQKWFLHPILIFILSISALATSLFLYIYWYVEASVVLKAVVEKMNIDTGEVLSYDTWVVIMILSLLVGVILLGTFSIFIYSQKMIQLYRLQNNFINSFTHELKTPVTSLKLFLQTFSKHDLPRADQKKYLGYMLADVGRLSENINRILNLARIEGKTYQKEFVKTDLPAFIQRFIEDNQHLFTNSRIRLHPPSVPLPEFRLNPPLFEMLLMNLMTNALKYNTAAVPQVDIRFDCLPNVCRVRFEDNGIGIEKKYLRKIFKKFYQVGDTDDMTAKGSGLGLYLVQIIANIHDWKVRAESGGAGKGAAFTLTMPV